jgi:hypothetical protein
VGGDVNKKGKRPRKSTEKRRSAEKKMISRFYRHADHADRIIRRVMDKGLLLLKGKSSCDPEVNNHVFFDLRNQRDLRAIQILSAFLI